MSEADYEPMEKPGEEWFFKGGQMSEKRGPFDAAIRILQEYVEGKRGWAGIYPEHCSKAIRILEAAGQLDKVEAIAHFTEGMTEDKNCQICKTTLALLESLPEIKS